MTPRKEIQSSASQRAWMKLESGGADGSSPRRLGGERPESGTRRPRPFPAYALSVNTLP